MQARPFIGPTVETHPTIKHWRTSGIRHHANLLSLAPFPFQGCINVHGLGAPRGVRLQDMNTQVGENRLRNNSNHAGAFAAIRERKSSYRQIPPTEYAELRDTSRDHYVALAKQLKIAQERMILDVGCGIGTGTMEFSRLTGARLTGLDKSSARISEARRRYPSGTWILGDIQDQCMQPTGITLATMVLSFHRFLDRRRALTRIFGLLPVGGRVAIASLSHKQLSARMDLACFPRALQMELERFPDIPEIVEGLRHVGFEVGKPTATRVIQRAPHSSLSSWIEKRPFSALRMLTSKEFEEGFRTFKGWVRTQQNPARIVNAGTLVVGTRRR